MRALEIKTWSPSVFAPLIMVDKSNSMGGGTAASNTGDAARAIYLAAIGGQFSDRHVGSALASWHFGWTGGLTGIPRLTTP